MNRIATLILLILMLSLVACGGDADDEHMEMDTPMSDTLEVTGVWGRNSPMVAPNGAFYMMIANGTDSDEKLLSASADICGVAELHEMYVKENDVMGMRPVPDGLAVCTSCASTKPNPLNLVKKSPSPLSLKTQAKWLLLPKSAKKRWKWTWMPTNK